MDCLKTTIKSKEISTKHENKLLAVNEVVLTYLSIIGLMWMSELVPGFESWQREFMGRAILSATIYMALPTILLIYCHDMVELDNPLIFKGKKIKKSISSGFKALIMMFPATFAFPIAERFNVGNTDWSGAAIIGTFYLAATVGLLWLFKGKATVDEKGFSIKDASIAGWIFLGGLLGVILFHPLIPVASDIIIALVFVGFLEEFFFRGYIQPRLNLAFEKKFEFLNLQFGWGLIIASSLFGLIHVISPGDNPMQWAWGFWTFTAGLGFGVIREKCGSFLAPAIVHGFTMILPVVFSNI